MTDWHPSSPSLVPTWALLPFQLPLYYALIHKHTNDILEDTAEDGRSTLGLRAWVGSLRTLSLQPKWKTFAKLALGTLRLHQLTQVSANTSHTVASFAHSKLQPLPKPRPPMRPALQLCWDHHDISAIDEGVYRQTLADIAHFAQGIALRPVLAFCCVAKEHARRCWTMDRPPVAVHRQNIASSDFHSRAKPSHNSGKFPCIHPCQHLALAALAVPTKESTLDSSTVQRMAVPAPRLWPVISKGKPGCLEESGGVTLLCTGMIVLPAVCK